MSSSPIVTWMYSLYSTLMYTIFGDVPNSTCKNVFLDPIIVQSPEKIMLVCKTLTDSLAKLLKTEDLFIQVVPSLWTSVTILRSGNT